MKLKTLLKESVMDMSKSYKFGAEVRSLETMPSLGPSDYSAMASDRIASQSYPGEGADGHTYCPNCMCETKFNEGKCMECSWNPLTEERHDVAMTLSNVKSIAQSVSELLQKLESAEESTELPAWIEDHISRADDLINQAAKGYYEEHNDGEVRHYIREKQKLSKKQKQLDVDKDGEIEASDLKSLRSKK
jgi:hypothetical protein